MKALRRISKGFSVLGAAVATGTMALMTNPGLAQVPPYAGGDFDSTAATVGEYMQKLVDFLTAGATFVVVAVAVMAGLKMMKALLGFGKGAGLSG